MSIDHRNPDDDALAQEWLAAIARPPLARGLESIYEHAAREIDSRAPACWASGRCCNFERTGHRLYVTGLEAAYTLSRAPATPSLADLNHARARGGCPFQESNLCGVHAIKPLGCRLYFCDRTAQSWQHELSERLLADIRALHESHAITYRYAEWRAMLSMFTS